MDKPERKPREIGMVEAILLLIVVVGVILVNSIFLKIGTGLSVLSVAMIVAAYGMLFLRVPWEKMLDEILKTFQVGMGAVLILLMVGILGASWIISGTIPMLIRYGLQLINPSVYLLIAFLLCVVLGVAMGSAWGLIGSVGLALMGVAQGLGIPAPIAAAAIAGGAYVGDMWSPFSDIPNLAAATTRGNSFDVFRAMIPTQIPALIVSVAFYLILGIMTSKSGSYDNSSVLAIQNTLSGVYQWNILLLIPPVIVIVGSVMQFPTIPVLTASALVSVAQAVIHQGMDFAAAFNALYNGSVSNTGIEAIDGLLSGGGMLNMMSLILIIFCAFIFAGILEGCGVLNPIMTKLTSVTKSRGLIILISMLTGILSIYLTASVYVAIILNTRIWAEVYRKNGMSTLNLARTMAGGISNWGMIVPWSGGVVMIAGVYGIGWTQYVPFLICTFASMFFIILFGFMNKFIIPLEDDELELTTTVE